MCGAIVNIARQFVAGAVILLVLTLLDSNATAGTAQPLPWEEKYQQLQLQRDLIFARFVEIHSVLVPRVQEEDPALLTRLSLETPKPRITGYRLLPEIQDNVPQVPVAPKQTFYSLQWLEGRLNEEFESVEKLADQLSGTTEFEPLVASFEQSLNELRTLENNLSYHQFWQKAVVRYAAFFREKNELVLLAREMNTLILNQESPELIAELRQRLGQRLAPFRATRGLRLLTLEGGEKVLPLIVCTDIEDQVFLQEFQTGVHEAFSHSEAARSHQFSVNLKWRLIGVDTLYQKNPPGHGASIDLEAHRNLFPDCPLVLTTGASSTHARVGDYIFLGTDPESRRTLAHEFGHLLGFSDAYIRGYDGDPGGEYGAVIVEWAGLSDDLMGSPGGGRVSSEMIETLLTAY